MTEDVRAIVNPHITVAIDELRDLVRDILYVSPPPPRDPPPDHPPREPSEHNEPYLFMFIMLAIAVSALTLSVLILNARIRE